MAEPSRRVLLVTHTGRPAARKIAHEAVSMLTEYGIEVRVPETEAADLGSPLVVSVAPDDTAAAGCEIVVVLGGDGTLLRGAELARSSGVPVLGVNLGHVGFLAEAEVDDLRATVDRVVERRYEVEERMSLDMIVTVDGKIVEQNWALNEASVEKAARKRMLEVVAEVDGRPLSRWGCDGVICATPTGSTAYAFSAGGPVVWPEVQALLMVPISAHALFARPLVVAPTSVLAFELVGAAGGVLWWDGRRLVELPRGARVGVPLGGAPVAGAW